MEILSKIILVPITRILAFSLLSFFTFGCSDNQSNKNEEVADESEVIVIDEDQPLVDNQSTIENEGFETNTSDAETRLTYNQSPNLQKDDNKLVLNTTSNEFRTFDKDNNKIVNKNELYDGLFAILDSDGNNVVTEAEFKDSKQDFISKNPQGRFSSFSNWDTDTDNELTKEEFIDKFSSIVDVPNNETLAQNTYVVWDTDNDDRIEKLELDNVVFRFDKNDN